MAATAYEPVIGLEVHAQLKTQSKMFCGCGTEFGRPPNTQVCPVCLGLPGSLPVPNKLAFEFALKTALALHCEVVPFTKFDRKNYYYPDLPKNYQISQYDLPFSKNGYLDITVDGATRRIGITRVHMEEDAGKLVHADGSSGVDLNRAGTPLLEIVSEPDLRTPAEARAYMEALAHILEFIGVCDCNMQEGSLRCDANVSIRPVGQEKLNTRREIKNMNSFRFVEQAIVVEIAAQKAIYDSGGTVRQETRLFHGDTGEIKTMRSKEEAQDYRYFPEPDLPPITVTEEMLARLRGQQEELPAARKERYVTQYKLSDYDAKRLTDVKGMGDYFEGLIEIGIAPKTAANWIANDLQGELNLGESHEPGLTFGTNQNCVDEEDNPKGFAIVHYLTGLSYCPMPPSRIAELILMVENKQLNRNAAKEIVFPKMLETKKSALDIAKAENLLVVVDAGATEQVVDNVLAKFPKLVADYVGGKDAAINAIFGKCMAEFKGKGDPGVIRPLLEKKLKALRETK